MTELHSPEDPVQARCKTEVYTPSKTPWENIRDDILAIERAHFGDNAFEEDVFVADFGNPENTVVLLRDTESGRIVGFTYAEPLTNFPTEKWETITPTVSYPKARGRDDNGRNTAYVSDTALDPAYVGHHLVGGLIGRLEQELRARKDTQFTRLERHSAEAHNYAANVRKSYGDRIMYEKPVESKYGNQIFFRIELVHPEL